MCFLTLPGVFDDVLITCCFFPEARVVMTATQEEITETIMTTEMRHAHLM